MFLRLLFESFRHQRRRKLLAGLAILLGTTAVTAMLALATTIGDRIHAELAVYGANIVITPAAQNLAINIGGTDIHPALGNTYLHESDLSKLRTIFWANNITGISPELTIGDQTVTVDGETAVPVKVVGMWFDHDLNGLRTGAPQLHPYWKLEGAWPQSCSSCTSLAVVVGSKLAAKLNLHRGSTLALLSSNAVTRTGRQAKVSGQVEGHGFSRAANAAAEPRLQPLRSAWPSQLRPVSPTQAIPSPPALQVVGILRAGDRYDDEILTDLRDVQANTPDAVDRVEVSARTKPEDAFARRDPDTLSPADHDRWYCRPYANSIAYQIREAIPNSDAQQVRQVEQSEGNVLKRISGLMWLIAAAALIAAGFAVSAAIATAVLERRAEIGLMRSLGAGAGRIALLFYTEAALLAVVAGTVGYLAGSTLAATLGAHIFGTTASATTASHITAIFNPVLLPITLGLALLVALAGSTPAIRSALHLDPSAILRGDA